MDEAERDLQALRGHCVKTGVVLFWTSLLGSGLLPHIIDVNTVHRAMNKCCLKLCQAKNKAFVNTIQNRCCPLWTRSHLKWTEAKRLCVFAPSEVQLQGALRYQVWFWLSVGTPDELILGHCAINRPCPLMLKLTGTLEPGRAFGDFDSTVVLTLRQSRQQQGITWQYLGWVLFSLSTKGKHEKEERNTKLVFWPWMWLCSQTKNTAACESVWKLVLFHDRPQTHRHRAASEN